VQEATRAHGLEIMRGFAPRMGRRYAKGRNFDRGPGAHRDVSTLSPYLRRRLVLEQEAVATALGAHGHAGAEKFIQEVIWRGYFKGWLEHRPGIWQAYRDGLMRDLERMEGERRLRRVVVSAEAGETGLACFDAWARELVETGYLHNHARMWFASIWIFTFGLPWRLGADFFLRHLLDGDPASNTLGWRWVAGLHMRGKPYVARAANIETYTDGRFAPRPIELAQDVTGLEGEEREGLPPVMPLRVPRAPDAAVPSVLLLTEEDCCAEDFVPDRFDLRGVVTLAGSHLRSTRAVAKHVLRVEARALSDAAARGGWQAEVVRAGVPGNLAAWAGRCGARQIVTPYVPVGPLRDWLIEAQAGLEARGIVLAEWQRDWDRAIWPHATAGFFGVRKQIPRILSETGLG
jgi:deoxyribodipyrimidine photo-lyase